MGAPRKEMAQYDHLASIRENWPKSAVRVEPSDESKTVKWIFYDSVGRRLCSAKTASWTPEAPSYCGTWNITANKRCKLHGGKSPSGEANGRFRTGKFSGSIPTRLAATYEESLSDPNLLTLRHEIALLDARLNELLQRADQEGGSVLDAAVYEAWAAFLAAKRSGDAVRLSEATFKMDAAVKASYHDSSLWREVEKLTEQRRKLVVSEATLMLKLGASVPIEKVNVMIGYILAMVNHRVSDKDEKWSLTDDILKLAGRGGLGGDVPTLGERRALNAASDEE